MKRTFMKHLIETFGTKNIDELKEQWQIEVQENGIEEALYNIGLEPDYMFEAIDFLE